MSTAASSKKCPLCRKPSREAHAPFCSQGCRDRDLLKWLGDDYRVPGPPADEGAFGSDER
ncbi:MAG TPA: DNA gyrase inhibitor YacG [Allosphingosinicella sp.]|nr:DNA gyrase inhibitor YacG [Allosphingosinicella sp.]